jgi:hypothetical protein
VFSLKYVLGGAQRAGALKTESLCCRWSDTRQQLFDRFETDFNGVDIRFTLHTKPQNKAPSSLDALLEGLGLEELGARAFFSLIAHAPRSQATKAHQKAT